MNSFIKHDDTGDKKGKEINKNVVESMIDEEYQDNFFQWKQMLHKMKRIGTKLEKMYEVKMFI